MPKKWVGGKRKGMIILPIEDFSNHSYKTLFKTKNIEIIAPNKKGVANNTPMMSNSPSVIYGIVDKNGNPKQLAKYENNFKIWDYDLDHDHTDGDFPNGHIQEYNKGVRSREYKWPNDEQLELAEEFRKGVKKNAKRRL